MVLSSVTVDNKVERSRSQIIFRYLPGSIFLHEDGFVARTWRVDGDRIEAKVNKKALLDAIEVAASKWPNDRCRIPLPSTVPASDYAVIEPTLIVWDMWPFTFQCSNKNCGRVRRFFRADNLVDYADTHNGLRCAVCERRLEQIPYFAAHACGSLKEMYTPTCTRCHKKEDVYLQDTGSFETSSWRCRGCGDYHIQSTRFVPCNCGDYQNSSGRSFMRMYTVRDRRSHYPQYVSLINIDSDQYKHLQTHPSRGIASLASFLGDVESLGAGLRELDSDVDTRMTAQQWAEHEEKLREIGYFEEDIEIIKKERGPVKRGVAGVNMEPALVDAASDRLMLERAALLDTSGLQDRRALHQAAAEADGADRLALDRALAAARGVGVQTISASLEFPVLLAAFGYTRQARTPFGSTLHSFEDTKAYHGKIPVFAVPAETESLIVELSARAVYGWLSTEGHVPVLADLDERTARLKMLEVFATDAEPAGRARRLVHSLSHTFLRALDDGQSGFGESSLAEWMVPQGLTFAIYVSSYQEFNIGALWTLMHSRVREWMERIQDISFRCQNDPLCHNRSPRACERCLYLTFGCPMFNDGLSRKTVMSFLRYQGQQT